MNSWRPTWLGGVPRSYVVFSNTPNIQEVLALVEMVEQGRFKGFSRFRVRDGRRTCFEAYERATSKGARGEVFVRLRPE
ncbi:hypothetical protein LZ30DRAFT_812416 [Colletotrichum cereale]|nr:hypothetical protein LZ30DRAFT_812416 [Colletotrichum cereale]